MLLFLYINKNSSIFLTFFFVSACSSFVLQTTIKSNDAKSLFFNLPFNFMLNTFTFSNKVFTVCL